MTFDMETLFVLSVTVIVSALFFLGYAFFHALQLFYKSVVNFVRHRVNHVDR